MAASKSTPSEQASISPSCVPHSNAALGVPASAKSRKRTRQSIRMTPAVLSSPTESEEPLRIDELKELIREGPHYPKPGVLFYRLTTQPTNKKGLHDVIHRLLT